MDGEIEPLHFWLAKADEQTFIAEAASSAIAGPKGK
jgi:hypothetical protein